MFNYTNNRNRYRQGGGVLVEFALIVPILVVIVFGITELGRALLQNNTMTKAVEGGARYMARVHGALDTGCQEGGNWSAGVIGAQDVVVSYAGSLGLTLTNSDVTVTHSSQPLTIDVDGDGNPDVSACMITVRVSTVFSPLAYFGKIPLHAEAQERYIGE